MSSALFLFLERLGTEVGAAAAGAGRVAQHVDGGAVAAEQASSRTILLSPIANK